jgi:hydrogenase maturation protein HypF
VDDRTDTIRRCELIVEGLVQGIGFRPFVHRLASRLDLHGAVRNDRRGVTIDVEGAGGAVQEFVDALVADGSRRVAVAWRPPRGTAGGFRIEPSALGGATSVEPGPDVATCAACLSELDDPTDRRYRYPLLTCTACGPRFTILLDLPWARALTTMAGFTPCAACQHEYEEADDRRFHSEATACPECGPRLALRRGSGEAVGGVDPIVAVADAIAAGAIVAIKGVGGYHLACDAMNDAAVAELRRRKRRDARPFALMVGDLDGARQICLVSTAEAELLVSPARPIVLLRRRPDPDARVSPAVAPRLRELGVMLPYTPLHHLLLRRVARPLVMTSANTSDEPLIHDDTDARARLVPFADLVLSHDRRIHAPCDDSVARIVRGAPTLVRRARGYVPRAVRLPVDASAPILACGGELKSVFAMARGANAFVSPHLGDLGDARAWRAWLDMRAHFDRLLGFEPRVVAHDLHPGHRTTRYANEFAGVERIGVQHHHAHVASCLADNGVAHRVLGIAWDGTGYGPDGTVWGGEFLLADLDGFERVGHFTPVPMPGGDSAIREPWRMAGSLLQAAYGEETDRLELDVVRRIDRAGWRHLRAAIAHGINAPVTSSAGRLFDAVASMLGVRDAVSFEGQAAMELEALAAAQADRVYEVRTDDVDGRFVVRTTDIVRGVADDLLAGVGADLIAARFHATLACVIGDAAEDVRRRLGIMRTALSGGVFQNARLLEAAIETLEARGFEVLRHRQVPPNDGGLALGQAAIAARAIAGRAR